MNKTVDFFFDLGSPASYLAWTQLPGLCARQGATLRYRPMLLGGVFQATGNASPVMIPAKGRYMFTDLARFAARYGVPFGLPPLSADSICCTVVTGAGAGSAGVANTRGRNRFVRVGTV